MCDAEARLVIWRAFAESSPRAWLILGYIEGRFDVVRSVLFRQGRRKFGAPPLPEQKEAMNAIVSLARLETLAEKLLDVTTWDDLLAGE